MAAKLGDAIWQDILDTIDLFWSKNRPLLPTIQRDSNDKATSYDKEAAEN